MQKIKIYFFLCSLFLFISYHFDWTHATIKQSFWHIITTLLQNVCGTYNNLNYENVTAENESYTYHADETKEFLYLCSYSQNIANEYGYFIKKTTWTFFTKMLCRKFHYHNYKGWFCVLLNLFERSSEMNVMSNITGLHLCGHLL